MNLSYFRKTEQTVDETVKKLKTLAAEKNLKVLGETELPGIKGQLLTLCNPEWMDKILSNEHQLLGLLPCSILVMEKVGQTLVGVGNPQLVGGVVHIHELENLFAEMDVTLRELINQSAGVRELKPTKIRLFATTTCPYCKAEKAFLEEKRVKFDYVLVDQDRAAAQEVVEKTGQMGVPVTEISYEDGVEPEYIIGFDRPRLEKILA